MLVHNAYIIMLIKDVINYFLIQMPPDFIKLMNVYMNYILICPKVVHTTEDKTDPSLCISG